MDVFDVVKDANHPFKILDVFLNRWSKWGPTMHLIMPRRVRIFLFFLNYLN